MSFAEIQFPTDISYGSSGGPSFSTDIVSTFSGHEQRNSNWSQARGRWNVAHGVKSKQQLEALIAFFHARRGRAEGFRFKDWGDYRVTNGIIAEGDGSTSSFQLVKRYESGTVHQRVISKPVDGSVIIYVDGNPQSGVTVDITTGMVTLASAPANETIITADFEFDVPVRFDTDQMMLSQDTFNTGSWQDIPIVELRV